jgi:hypothetical protein
MQHVRLGRTGLRVSRLCLGTMNFGPQTTEADSFAIMDRALDEGVDFLDTANVYGWRTGEGVTEQIVGRWLAQDRSRRNRIVLATKVYGKMGNGPNDRGLSAYHIRRACEESLRRLGTDHLVRAGRRGVRRCLPARLLARHRAPRRWLSSYSPRRSGSARPAASPARSGPRAAACSGAVSAPIPTRRSTAIRGSR